MRSPFPQPPRDSRLTLDHDEQGRPRLSWVPPPVTAAGYLVALAVAGGCGVGLYFLISGPILEQINAIRNVPGGFRFAVAVGALVGFGLFALLITFIGCMILYALVRGSAPEPEHITLDESALRLDPGVLSEHEGLVVETINRPEIGKIGVEQIEGRQRLTIDRGIERLEIAATLNDDDKEWLAGALRAWAGLEEAPAVSVPRPPDNSWLIVEGDEELLEVRWQPVPGKFDPGRWNFIAGASVFLLLWVTLGTVLKVVCIGLVIRLFLVGFGGWDVCSLVFLVLLLLWLIGWTRGAHRTLRELREALRKPQPENVTLTATTLCHDPGRFCLGGTVHSGRPREMPHAEIRAIRLEREGGSRQRLVVDHGGEPIEVGRCLREPEREWLAEVLHTWARGTA